MTREGVRGEGVEGGSWCGGDGGDTGAPGTREFVSGTVVAGPCFDAVLCAVAGEWCWWEEEEGGSVKTCFDGEATRSLWSQGEAD